MIRVHVCADEPERKERHWNETARARIRYHADPERFRAYARAQYAKHRERYAAASLERQKRAKR